MIRKVVKNIKELNGLRNELFYLDIYNDLYVEVKSKINNRTKEVVYAEDIEDLIDYGFNIKILDKITIDMLECIADELLAGLMYSPTSRRWFFKKGNDIQHIEPVLEDMGYYI